MGLGAQGVKIDGLGLLLHFGRRRLACNGKQRGTHNSESHRKSPGLPLPRTQPYLEFYLNHAKIDDESQETAFNRRQMLFAGTTNE